MSVEAIDVVTADGELVRADETQNSRPAVGRARRRARASSRVVTRFHLRLQPRPPVVANGVYLYPLDVLDEVFTLGARDRPAGAAHRWS